MFFYFIGTFRLTKKGPFKQLFSLHAFIRKDGEIKQIPLVLILMSRRMEKTRGSREEWVVHVHVHDNVHFPQWEFMTFDNQVALLQL